MLRELLAVLGMLRGEGVILRLLLLLLQILGLSERSVSRQRLCLLLLLLKGSERYLALQCSLVDVASSTVVDVDVDHCIASLGGNCSASM